MFCFIFYFFFVKVSPRIIIIEPKANPFLQFVHGLSVPVGKAGYHIPRTISSALSTPAEPEPIRLPSNRSTHSTATVTSPRGLRLYRNRQQTRKGRDTPPPRIVFQIPSAGNQHQQEQDVEYQHQQQERDREQEEEDQHAVAPESSTSHSMPATPTPVTIHEPSRPVILVGDDGRITETLNAVQE